jgi:23S rRNA (uracil1939-C5)-methyltransferase
LVNAIFRDIDTYARASGLPTYDPKRATGFWRHLVIRQGKKTGEIMVIFSVNSSWSSPPENGESEGVTQKGIHNNVTHPNLPLSGKGLEPFFTQMVRELTAKYPQIASVYFLENTGRADIVAGNAVLLHGQSTIIDELLGLTFEIQPKSFFQVNTLGAEKLYTQAIDYIHNKNGVLLDLYAGTGTIGILLAPHFQKVYSVELVESSSRDGEKNATRNAIANVEFVNAKVEDFASDFAKQCGHADTIVLDPPREGLHPSAIPHILSFGASEIIYVSCNPSTLVRDLSIMMGIAPEGTDTDETSPAEPTKKEKILPKYKITDITPMDMFPHTHHIETVVRLEKII